MLSWLYNRTILPTTLEASNGDPQDKSTHTTKVSFHLIIFDSAHDHDGVFVGLCLVFTLSSVSLTKIWSDMPQSLYLSVHMEL